MFCPNCGIRIPSSSQFCKHCGIEIALFKSDKKKEEEHKSYTPPPSYKSSTKKGKWIGWVFAAVIIGLIVIAGNSSPKNVTPPAGESNPVAPDCSNPPDGQTFNSLPNGQQISNSYSQEYFDGRGQLKITNGTSDDAVVKIINVSTNASVAEFYILANNNYTVYGIPDGNFNLFFSLGKNWSDSEGKFITCKSFTKFDDPFNFVTTDTQYSTFEVTLNPVAGGTASTTSVDESEFNKL